jgi:hypothetical protein
MTASPCRSSSPARRRNQTGDPGEDDRRSALCHLQRGGSQKGCRGARRACRRSRAQARPGRQGARRQQGLPSLPQDARRRRLRHRPRQSRGGCPPRRPLRAAHQHLLATRPIVHKTDAGIRGHVFCIFLALVLRKELIDRLAAHRSRLEWQRIIDDLADLSEIEVEQDGRRPRLRTALGPTIDLICRAIGLTLVSSLSLVRYRGTDYSVPTAYARTRSTRASVRRCGCGPRRPGDPVFQPKIARWTPVLR